MGWTCPPLLFWAFSVFFCVLLFFHCNATRQHYDIIERDLDVPEKEKKHAKNNLKKKPVVASSIQLKLLHNFLSKAPC